MDCRGEREREKGDGGVERKDGERQTDRQTDIQS